MKEKPLTEFMGSKKGAKEHKEKPAKPKVTGLKGPWELPEGWRWVRLGDVCNEIYRYPSFYGFERLEEGIPVIRIGNINDDGTLSSNRSEYIFIHPEIAHMYPRTLLKEGDLVMGVRGSIGKLAFIDKNFQGAQISPNLIRISPNPEVIHPRYLFRFMWYFTKFVLISKDSPVIPTITAKTIKKFPIPLPPLSEQKLIVAKLDELNRRLEEAKRLARGAREEAEKLMASALHEVFSKAEEKGWEWVRLDKLFTIQQGVSLSPKRREGKNPLPFLRTKNVRWGYVDVSELDYMDFTPTEVKKLNLKPGDLLVLEGGEIGRTAIWRGELEICLYQNHIHRLRRRSTDVLPEFYMYWMQAAYKVFNSYSKEGVRTAIPNLSKSRLASFKVPFPPLSEQKHIVAYLDSISERAQKLVKLYEERKKELEQLFPAILDRAFRGEL